jgi:soluble lytic murein transglycosylase-like protein
MALAGLLGLARPAAADIVKFTNGRTMTVEMCRFEGATAILYLRGGGEIRMDRDLIDELLPDEIPYVDTVSVEALAASPAAARAPMTRNAIRILVERAALRWGVPVQLAMALVSVESNFNPRAISHKGAMGLTQLMPATARQYGVRDPFDEEENLEAGMRHLRYLLDKFSRDVYRALAAYNAGEGAVMKYGAVPPYRETQSYVRRIVQMAQVR